MVEGEGASYSSGVGLVYVFNLIVGTGALAMPHAFQKAGWLLSFCVIVILAFTSYLTVTFVIESMAAANAVVKWRQLERLKQRCQLNARTRTIGDDTDSISESQESFESKPLLSNAGTCPDNRGELFDITSRMEMGKMASLFFNKYGVVLFYLCMVLYLYGDLAIYAAAVPKSLRDVSCTFTFASHHTNTSSFRANTTLDDDSPCWGGDSKLTRDDAYRLFVAVFAVCVGPFAFFNVQKTKLLQIFTSLMRWAAFGLMIVLAIIKIAEWKTVTHTTAAAKVEGIPSLFGVCVYSFMCHHSLPSLVTPIKDKRRLLKLFAADYGLIAIFYSTLSITAVFAFSEIRDLYTLNYDPDCVSDCATTVAAFQYFVVLFPVFTLSTSFPIIAITLKNNLKTLTEFLLNRDGRPFHWFVDRMLFPLVTILPPFCVALVTNNMDVLVGVTGSYAGVGIQYIIPAFLVYYSRKNTCFILGNDVYNKHLSPFKHKIWIGVILMWAVACIAFVTSNHIITQS